MVQHKKFASMLTRDLLHQGFAAAIADDRLRVVLPNRLRPDARNDVRTSLIKGLGVARQFARGMRAGSLRNGGAHARSLPVQTKQRVIVKAHVARHGTVAAAKAMLRSHIAYLERSGAGLNGEQPRHFNTADDQLDAKAHALGWAGDRHHFRFIISPENADHITDMPAYVRETMARVSRDLGEPDLDWIAVVHADTAQTHAHVLVRGRRADGRDLVIPRAYISYGFRGRAQEVAQELLGDLSRDVAERRLHRDAQSDRWTALDRELKNLADAEGFIPRGGELGRADSYGAVMRKRIAHLERLKLAERTLAGARLAADFDLKLRQMDLDRDVLKRLHARIKDGTHEVGPIEAESVAGRVVSAGHHDEIGRTPFAIIRDRNGREHYAALPAGTQPPALQSAARLTRFARGRARLIDLGRASSQVNRDRLTPLDRELTYRRREIEAGRSPDLFDNKVEHMLERRAAHLISSGHAFADSKGLRFTPAGYATLRDRDISAALKDQLGASKPLLAVAKVQMSGTYAGAISTASGIYAVVDRGAGLAVGRVAEAPGFALGAAVDLTPAAHGLMKVGVDPTRALDG